MRAFVTWGMRMRSTIFTMRRTAITVLFTGAVASCGTSFGAGSSLCVYPGSSALVAVRTSDPGDRFIWFLFLRGLVVFCAWLSL